MRDRETYIAFMTLPTVMWITHCYLLLVFFCSAFIWRLRKVGTLFTVVLEALSVCMFLVKRNTGSMWYRLRNL